MSLTQAGRMPPPLLLDSPGDAFWLWPPPKPTVDSPPALLWPDYSSEVVQAHETPMGACLLPRPAPPLPVKLEPPEIKQEPLIHHIDIDVKPLRKKRTPALPRHKKFSSPSPLRGDCKGAVAMVERWTLARYKEAEAILVEVMHRMGAEARTPVLRQALKDEVRKCGVGDTGLLDHLLKHMVGEVVTGGGERLRRLHNWEGMMEYWLEPVGVMCALEEEAGRLREEVVALRRDYQSMLQWKWMVDGDMEEMVVQGHEMGALEEEVARGCEISMVKGEEVARGCEMSMVEGEEVARGCEMSMVEGEEDVQGREIGLCGSLISSLSAGLTGWGVRRKVKHNRRRREIILPLDTSVEAMPVQLSQNRDRKKARHNESKKKRRGDEKDSRIMNRRCRGNPRLDRWTPQRYEAAILKLVEVMRKMKVGLWSPIKRHTLREEMRKHIGDTGLLDHLLKHLAGKVVTDGTERFQRRYSADGRMEYWLEPADLAEIRKKAGVRDPCWIPPVGWTLGDVTSPCPCGSKCWNEMSMLREEVATLKRQVEKLNSLSLLHKKGEVSLFEAGGLPELAELEERDDKIYDWYFQLLEGSEGSYLVDES